MTNEELMDQVCEKVYLAVRGVGLLKKNKVCKSLADQIYEEFGIKRHELTNEIICYIMRHNLMDRYRPENSLGWYVVGITWRYLVNRRQKLRICKKMDKELLIEIRLEQDDDIYSLPKYGNPEEIYLRKELHELVMKHVSQDEYDLLCGNITLAEFGKIEGISKSGAQKRKKTLTAKVLKTLSNTGYDNIN